MRLLGIALFISFISSTVWGSYLFSERVFQPNKRWREYSDDERENLRNLFRKLNKSKTGKELIKRARKKAALSNKKILEVIKAGNGSLTDTTLIRKFSMGRPDKISYESKSVVYINNELTQYDAVLDLAHELTHYIYRENFNPYEVNFSLSEFIKNTIEGRGGEVQAFIMECRVQQELFPGYKDHKYNCKNIRDDQGMFSFAEASKRFYQVGSYYNSFEQVLEKHGIRHQFPKISEEKSSFVSSAYGIPYPVAAFEEYLAVLNKVCQNDKRRLGYFKSSKGRSPASVSQFEKNYMKKCKNFL